MPVSTVDALMAMDERLHSYQIRAAQHLLDNPRSALFLEMGLGKTAITLSALQPEHLPAVVVAPKRIAENVWHVEAEVWRPDLKVAVAAGTPKQRKAAIDSGADVVVIGVNNLKDLPLNRFKTFVLDEMSLFKNRGSQRWKLMKKLTEKTPHVWGLTGTPSPNGYPDLWPQLFLLDRGKRLEPTLTKFREKYLVPGFTLPNGVIAKWTLQYRAGERIEQKISDICLSMRTEDYLDLPAVTFNDIPVTMPKKSWDVYTDFVADLTSIDNDGQEYTAANPAVALGKLSQITSGFLNPDVDDLEGQVWELHTDRLEEVVGIVETMTSPVVIFYQYIYEREWLLQHIKGSESQDSKGAIDRFSRGQLPVLVAHPSSAGHGLNFQHHCHTVIWCSLPWSLEQYQQANARVNRQGQKYPVVIHRLMVPNTVDETILGALGNKENVQDAILNSLK